MPKTAAEIKKEIQVIDRELYHLRELYRRYSRRLTKMGMAMWVGGTILFFATALFFIGLDVVLQVVNVWSALLIIALAAPIAISAMFVSRLEKKMKKMERMRKSLMEEFERAMMKRVGKLVSSVK
ncbi:MAG: hypothetical protein ACK4GQ_02685 [Candidatus Hadarchaeales archaeon]